mmetsp:Transcript_58705/g.187258  ORF Transcript_58705/g.187258 Transcript_58705/m.187258 type:complete len:201 (-) Transcript_58705:253-855(-)
MLKRDFLLETPWRRRKCFWAWDATWVGVLVGTKCREIPRQFPLPSFLRPTRNAMCSLSVHGIPFLDSCPFDLPSPEPFRDSPGCPSPTGTPPSIRMRGGRAKFPAPCLIPTMAFRGESGIVALHCCPWREVARARVPAAREAVSGLFTTRNATLLLARRGQVDRVERTLKAFNPGLSLNLLHRKRGPRYKPLNAFDPWTE